ncbi:MAG: DinB family protein [Acidobacteria bacterium]|nr:DinB family protein [Acidobacteriota bacterium]MBV9434972.1 DinB family protein [Acidobacteriota bacterium]
MPATAVRPAKNEYAPYYGRYISLVPDEDVLITLDQQLSETLILLRSLSEQHGTFRYEQGKWSVKEVLGHMVDTERIMSYRALCIARGERTPLPGFEQDGYVKNGNFDTRSVANLARDFEQVRRATISLFRSLHNDAWERRGIASDVEVTVRALAYIIAGHEIHHKAILKEKYGLGI